MVVGSIAAAGAVAVSAWRAPTAVYLDASGYHIGALVLREASRSPVPTYRLYTGAAALLLMEAPDGARATAVTRINGSPSTGDCRLARGAAGAIVEDCAFTLDGRRITAHDAFDAADHIWRRTYSDGVSVTFSVPAGTQPIPVPLPLGR